MDDAAVPLRFLQRQHALILLAHEEFAGLLGRGNLPLPKRHLEHFSKVMRRNGAWGALASDGHGAIATCEVQRGTLVLAADGVRRLQRTESRVRLVQAWPKHKALSLILQKAAELGAAEIIFVSSEHAAHPAENPARIEAILENACMQAYNPFKPGLTLGALTDAALYEETRNFYGNFEASVKLSQLAIPAGQKVAFVNGPEGGFSARERAWLACHATGILLSENVLRSETAAIIALGHFCQSP